MAYVKFKISLKTDSVTWNRRTELHKRNNCKWTNNIILKAALQLERGKGQDVLQAVGLYSKVEEFALSGLSVCHTWKTL